MALNKINPALSTEAKFLKVHPTPVTSVAQLGVELGC